MKKLIYIVLVITVVTACSEPTQTNVDDTLPEYDIEQYCQKWAEDSKKVDIDGLYSLSNRMFNHCLKEMKADYKWLKTNWNILSSESKMFCKQAVGSDQNYGILKQCAWAAICFEDHKGLKICEEREKPAWE